MLGNDNGERIKAYTSTIKAFFFSTFGINDKDAISEFKIDNSENSNHVGEVKYLGKNIKVKKNKILYFVKVGVFVV